MLRCEYEIVSVGASTGGPPLVCDLLTKLPAPFPLPIALVQHISEGFVHGLTRWLAEATGHEIVLCDKDQRLLPGRVYLAPEDRHLVMKSTSILGPSLKPPRKYQRPAVDELFESIGEIVGRKAIGIVMSGMGSDGTEGMKALHQAGALTIAQSPSSCVVDSMPRHAIESNSVKHVLTIDGIAELLRRRAEDSETFFKNLGSNSD
jgi:two-component system chemotaxis response regulator CheB